MQKKSSKYTLSKKKNPLETDILSIQKQAVRSAALDYFGASALFWVFPIVVLLIKFLDESSSMSDSGFYFVLVILCTISLWFLFLAIRRFSMFRKLQKIESLTERKVDIYCKKISFMFQPYSKHSSLILCAVFVNETGDKFHYIFPCAPFDCERKNLKKQFYKKRLELICYNDTNIVKEIKV